MSSKRLSKFRMLVVVAIGSIGATLANGCGWEFGSELVVWHCTDPKEPDYLSPVCVEDRCLADAAIPSDDCGASTEPSDASSALCVGTCVPNGPDDFEKPRPVYIGPPVAKYVYGCPPEIGDTGGRLYTGFNVPAQGCPTCVCGSPEGSCSTRPNSLFVHADLCGAPQSETLDFNGPTNWDGACTNVNAVPQGAECPPGSGNFCAQSVDSAELLEPVETCKPITFPVPNFTGDHPWWDDMVLSCNSSVLSGACLEAASETCLPS